LIGNPVPAAGCGDDRRAIGSRPECRRKLAPCKRPSGLELFSGGQGNDAERALQQAADVLGETLRRAHAGCGPCRLDLGAMPLPFATSKDFPSASREPRWDTSPWNEPKRPALAWIAHIKTARLLLQAFATNKVSLIRRQREAVWSAARRKIRAQRRRK